MSEVVIGADFKDLEKKQKENDKSVRAIDKSLREQARIIEAANTNMNKVLKGTMNRMGINNAMQSPAAQSRGPFMGNLGNVVGQARQTQQFNNQSAAIMQHGPGGGAPPVNNEFASAITAARVSLVAFAAAAHVGVSMMASASDAGKAGKSAGDIKNLAARAAKAHGGPAAYYESVFDKMGESERGQAAQFLETSIQRRTVDKIHTPLSAIHGGLSAIQRGRYTGGEATQLLTSGQIPDLQREQRGDFMSKEMKVRAMEGGLDAKGRNADYTERAAMRLWEADRNRMKLENPWTFGFADTVTHGASSWAYSGKDVVNDAGDARPGVGVGPGKSAAPTQGGERSGDMSSFRGMVQALTQNTIELRKLNTNEGRPPVNAGKN